MTSDPIDPSAPAEAGGSADPAALLAENLRLKERNSELEQGRRHRLTGPLRSTAVVVLLVLGALVATVSVPAIWGRNLVLNTDRYVQTLAPLADDPGVQAGVVKAIDAQFSAHVDVKGLVADVLPPRASVLAGPLATAADSLVKTVATRFVQSAAFAKLWRSMNRTAHKQLVGVLTGRVTKTSAIEIKGDTVTLNLASVVSAVKQRLVDAGLTVAANVPAVGATIEIAQLDGIDKARGYVRWLDRSAHWLPVIALALLVGAVFTARRRRRTVIAAALSVGAGMIVIALALAAGRAAYLNELPGTYLSRDTASHVFDVVVRYLRWGVRLVLFTALVVVGIAWLTGASRSAQATRGAVGHAPRSVSAWVARSRYAARLSANRGVTSIVVVALAGLVLVLWPNPTLAVVAVVVVVAAFLVAVVASLPRPPSVTSSPALGERDAFTPSG